MEALALPSLSSPTPRISPSEFHTKCGREHSGMGYSFKFSDALYGRLKSHRGTLNRIVPRMQLVEEEYELRQMKDMAAARKRWEALVREGKVKPLTPREAGYAIQLSGKTLLDVRPESEYKKARVKGSTWVPIFDVDNRPDIGALSKRTTNFVMDLWLRVSCSLLHNAGYNNLSWVQGGVEAAQERDLPREGPQPFKFAGIGGLSEFLGWTDQQRAAAAKEGWQYRFVFFVCLVGLFLAADALFLAAQLVGHYIQEIRSQ